MGLRTRFWRLRVTAAFPLFFLGGLATADEWVGIGPPGPASDVYSMALDPGSPSTIYVGTFRNSVLKTTDGGRTWTSMNNGLAASWILDLAIPPSLPQTLYASTDQGIFKSENGGASWTARSTGIPGGGRRQLAIDPANPSTVYTATCSGIYKSTDGGLSWNPAGSPFADCATAVAVDPASSSTLYAGTLLEIFKSLDGGRNWFRLRSSGGQGRPGEGVNQFVIDSSSPSTIYASTFDFGGVSPGGPPTGSILKSVDGGINWRRVNRFLPAWGNFPLATDPSSPTTLYVGAGTGVFKSTDGGETWNSLGAAVLTGGNSVIRLAVHPLARETVYASAIGGVFKHPATGSFGECTPDTTSLCLGNGLFRVDVRFSSPTVSRSAPAISLTPDTGAFWFFNPSNLELVVKILDGRAANGFFWVFYGSLTNVEFTLTVTATQTGTTKTYVNRQGQLASFADTRAF